MVDNNFHSIRSRQVYDRRSGKMVIQISTDGDAWHELGKPPTKQSRSSDSDDPGATRRRMNDGPNRPLPPPSKKSKDSQRDGQDDDAGDGQKSRKPYVPTVKDVPSHDEESNNAITSTEKYSEASEKAMLAWAKERFFSGDTKKDILKDFGISHDLEALIEKVIINKDEGAVLEVRSLNDPRLTTHKNVKQGRDQQITLCGITGEDSELFNLSKGAMESLLIELNNQGNPSGNINFAKYVIARKYCAQPGFMQLHPALQEPAIGIALVKGPEAAMWVIDNAAAHIEERAAQRQIARSIVAQGGKVDPAITALAQSSLVPDEAFTEKMHEQLIGYALKFGHGHSKLSDDPKEDAALRKKAREHYEALLAKEYGGKGLSESQIKIKEANRIRDTIARGHSPNPSFGNPLLAHSREKAAELDKNAFAEGRDLDNISYYRRWKGYYADGMDPDFFKGVNDTFTKYNHEGDAVMRELIDCWKHHHMLDVAMDNVITAEGRGKVVTPDGIVYGDYLRDQYLEGWIARAARRDPEKGDEMLRQNYALQKEMPAPPLVSANSLEAMKEGLRPPLPFVFEENANYRNYVIAAEPVRDAKGAIINYTFRHYKDCDEDGQKKLQEGLTVKGSRLIRITNDGKLQPMGQQSLALFQMAVADFAAKNREGWDSKCAEIRDCSHFTKHREGAPSRSGITETLVSTFMNLRSIPRGVESGVHVHLVQEDPYVRGLLLRVANGGEMPLYEKEVDKHTGEVREAEYTMKIRGDICNAIAKSYGEENVCVYSIHFDGPVFADDKPNPLPSGTFIQPSRNVASYQFGLDVREQLEQVGGNTTIKTTRTLENLTAKDMEAIHWASTEGLTFNEAGLQNRLSKLKMCLVELGNGAHPLESQNLTSVACLTAYEDALSVAMIGSLLKSGTQLYNSKVVEAVAKKIPNIKPDQIIAHYSTDVDSLEKLAQINANGASVPAGNAIINEGQPGETTTVAADTQTQVVAVTEQGAPPVETVVTQTSAPVVSTQGAVVQPVAGGDVTEEVRSAIVAPVSAGNQGEEQSRTERQDAAPQGTEAKGVNVSLVRPENTTAVDDTNEKPAFWTRVKDALEGLSDLMSGKSSQSVYIANTPNDSGTAVFAAKKILVADNLLPEAHISAELPDEVKNKLNDETVTALTSFQKKFDKPIVIGKKKYEVKPTGNLDKVTALAMNAYALADGDMDMAYSMMKTQITTAESAHKHHHDKRSSKQVSQDMKGYVSNTTSGDMEVGLLNSQALQKALQAVRRGLS